MEMLNPRTLKAQAAARQTEQHRSPRRLALVHAGVIFLALMAVSGINYYVNQRMNTATGLSGMGMLSVLETVQTVLGYALNLALPFWQMGFVFAALRMARREQVGTASLAEGFRRFGPVLRLMLLRGLMFGGLFTACVYVGVIIYVLTPLAWPLMDLLQPLMEAGQSMEQVLELFWQLPEQQIAAAIAPAFIIVIPVCLLVMLPVYYRFRLADLVIMDQPATRAFAALRISSTLTRNRRVALLRLDLSFWWYFLLQLVGILVSDLELLPLDLGIPGLVTYILGAAVQMAAFWFAGSYFHTTWAVTYDQLLRQPIPVPQPKAAPQNIPWDDYHSEN